MIFIVDSGATKADWTALNEKRNERIRHPDLGLNPEVLTEEIAMERLTTNEQLNDNRKRAPTRIFLRSWMWNRTT